MFELTDDMALPDPVPPPAASPSGRVPEGRAAGRYRIQPENASARALRPPAYEPPPFESAAAPAPQQILSRSTVSAASNPPSPRSPTPCSATTRGRWKTWSRKCCASDARNPGSTTICRDWWNASSRPKSSGFPARALVAQDWHPALIQHYNDFIVFLACQSG